MTHPKFVQIAVGSDHRTPDRLYALDDAGEAWVLGPDGWVKLEEAEGLDEDD